MRSGRKIATTLIGFALAVLLGAGTFLHTALDSSSPAAGERLAAPPSEVRLTFTTPVDPRLARVGLLTADSVAVALDSLRAGESSAVVVAPVAGSMSGGEFTVTWQVIGSDGHPVRGRFAFVLDAPAAAAEPPAVADPEVGPPPLWRRGRS